MSAACSLHRGFGDGSPELLLLASCMPWGRFPGQLASYLFVYLERTFSYGTKSLAVARKHSSPSLPITAPGKAAHSRSQQV